MFNPEKIKDFISQNSQAKELWDNFYARTQRDAKTKGIAKSTDTLKWWHLAWERLGDAAFACFLEPTAELEQFVHDATLEICEKSADEWLGPWFRKRTKDNLGQLETAHAGVAAAISYIFCERLFSEQERKTIFDALRVKCQEPCGNFLRGRPFFNNWSMVLLNGYVTASCVLGDRKALSGAMDMYEELLSAYNTDSYGESLQYSSYASAALCHIHEMITAYAPEFADRLRPQIYGDLMPWYAASFMYMKPLGGEWGEEILPRSLNFGDSAAIFRPSGDLLIHIAARLNGTGSPNAGLAKYLFDTTYKYPAAGPCDRSSFAFFNNYHYLTFLLLPMAAKAITPQEAGLGLLMSFETGTIAVRDSWEKPKLILGIQGGYQPCKMSTHRHLDQNSFILAYNGERMLIDPGHCCYRLNSQIESTYARAHSTWVFEDESGDLITQEEVSGNIRDGVKAPLNTLRYIKSAPGVNIISSDAAAAYGENFIKAERTWFIHKSNVIIIADRIETKKPVKAVANFVANNRDALTDERIFYSNRVVLRRGNTALKILPITDDRENVHMTPHWGFVHDCYHPEPNQKGQAKEGSALIYRFSTGNYSTAHMCIYALIIDEEKNIRYWHAEPEDKGYKIDPPGHSGGLTVKVEDNCIEITDCENDESYIL